MLVDLDTASKLVARAQTHLELKQYEEAFRIAPVLRSGGWARLKMLEREFGPLQDKVRVPFWAIPDTTLGSLQCLGVMYTGRLFASTDRETAAVIPVDLREPLEVALSAPKDGKKHSHRENTMQLPGTEQAKLQCDSEGSRVVRLKVTLKGVSPPIWRRLRVPCDITLHALHQVIQRSAPWADQHLYEFRIRGQRYGVPDKDSRWDDTEYIKSKKTLLKDIARPGIRFTYCYDFGDSWEHEVIVEGVGVVPEPLAHAECLDGQRAFPPDDCGGTPGYQHLVKALRDPDDPSHQEMLDWIGDFDPERFDITAVNASLRRLRLGGKTRGEA